MPTAAWRDAESADRPAIQRFTCAAPTPRHANGRPQPHPRPWELEVQRWIRRDVKPPARRGATVRLGHVDDELASVLWLGDTGDPEIFKMHLLGVGLGFRGHGGAIADAAINDGVTWCSEAAGATGAEAFSVFALTDPRNAAAERMLARNSFTQHGMSDQGLTRWLVRVGATV